MVSANINAFLLLLVFILFDRVLELFSMIYLIRKENKIVLAANVTYHLRMGGFIS